MRLTKFALLLRCLKCVFLCTVALYIPGPSLLGQSVEAVSHITDLDSLVGPELRPSCSSQHYLPVPPPDLIALLLKSKKRYRLVIGAGEFLDQPTTNDRTFVAPTAMLVDDRLANLGYMPLPSLSLSHTPYLVGKNATKDAVRAALREMAAATSNGDIGIVYYVGHGEISPGGNDLSLAVYDREVAADEGYRFGDMIGELQTSVYRSNIAEIPHLFIILDACFSGTVAQGAVVGIANAGGVQRLVEIAGAGPVIPDQVAVLTATAPGSNSSAYELHGTGLSAFGYYFARALKEDWDCSDSISRDGILTLQELSAYLKSRLKLASSQNALDAPMAPSMLKRDLNTFLAYRPDKYIEPGLRVDLLELDIQPPADKVATITLASGATVICADATGCKIPVSKSLLKDTLTVLVEPSGVSKGSVLNRFTTFDVGEVVRSLPAGQKSGRIQVNFPDAETESAQLLYGRALIADTLKKSLAVSGAIISTKQ